MKTCYFLFCALVLFSGCVSSSLPDGYTGKTAIIKDSAQMRGFSKSYFFVVSKVSGRAIETSEALTRRKNQGNGFSMYPEIVERPIPAGRVELEITAEIVYAADILALVSKNFRVQGNVTFDAIADAQYVVTGVIGENEGAVWVKEAKSGRMVTEMITKKK